MGKKRLLKFFQHQTILVIISLIVVILITMAASNAFFTATVKGDPVPVNVTSGDLDITFTSSSNNIDKKIYIQTDEEGKNTNPNNFTIKNSGNVLAAYDIVIVNTSDGIEGKDIRYKLNKTNESGIITNLDTQEQTVIKHVESIAPGAADSYELRVWLSNEIADSNQEEVLSKQKKVKLEMKIVSKASANSSELSNIS